MKKKLTVTIGIPAHNEEENIASLLLRILEQKTNTVILKEIIIFSDGSKDNTVKIAKSIRDTRTKIFHSEKRAGKNATVNSIVKKACGDILVLFDGDVVIEGKNFIDTICAPLINNPRVGLVGAKTYPLQPNSVFETIIAFSHIAKYALFQKINNQDNVYLCHGRARAFSKKLYKKIQWPKVCPEDSFSYFFCKANGFKFVYQKHARVLFRSPTNIHDHIKQSARFIAGKDILKKHFPIDMVYRAYQIPLSLSMLTFLVSFKKAPVTFFSYITLQICIALFSRVRKFPQRYDTSASTKKLAQGMELPLL